MRIPASSILPSLTRTLSPTLRPFDRISSRTLPLYPESDSEPEPGLRGCGGEGGAGGCPFPAPGPAPAPEP
ncbi:MAG: hypothetical protein QXN86_04680 [Candidatus Methanomethylicaceae archaeon]